jgi:photosystem II stability/assembly factor-like uncharacterized protein
MSGNGWLGRVAQSGCRKFVDTASRPVSAQQPHPGADRHPTRLHTVFAGGDTGLFVSHDGGARWERITSTNGALPTIWSLAIDPVDPDILFAGTRPAAVYRSRDGGQHWEKLAVDVARECSIGTPFVTSVIVDPDDHRIVWAGVEIDGVFRSTDGGDTWMHLETGLYDPDIHAVTIAATQPKRVFASTAREMFTSNDLGETWRPLGIKEKWPLPYARGMVVKADDPGVLFAGCGETTTGEKGHVLRTTNFGETWEILPLSSQELSPNLGDGLRDQAAAVWDCEDAGLAATSIPSVNLTP